MEIIATALASVLTLYGLLNLFEDKLVGIFVLALYTLSTVALYKMLVVESAIWNL